MKKATAEQKARAQARRARIRELAKGIAAMPEADRVSLAASHGVKTIEGHELSIFNHCLLLTQNPNISVVGGFRQWKRAGRSVKKGESGLALWCPVGKPKAQPDSSELDAPADDPDKPRFILGTVFDVAQTQESNSEREAVA